MTLLPPLFRKRFRMVVSCVLVVVGAAGFVHAVRAAIAQKIYLETKHGVFKGLKAHRPPVVESREVAARAWRADTLYAHNYYFPAYAAKCALVDALAAASSDAFNEHLSRADFLARQAVAMNPYASEGCMVYALVLAEGGRLQAAIAYWRDVVLERAFWNPDNHAFMARLYLRSSRPGDMRAAVAELPFVRDREIREQLRRLKQAMGM